MRYPKRLLALLIVAAAIAPAGCKRNSEALASFEGGEVTRGELRMIFKLSRGKDAEKAATIKAQDNILRSLAIMKMAAAESRKAGLDKDPAYVQSALFLDRRAALEAFNAHIRLNADDHEFEMMEVQHLLLRNRPGPDGKPQSGSRQAEAEELLKKLNAASDDEVASTIREKTELDLYKPVAGYEIPICVSCSMNPQRSMTEKLKTTEEGKFVHIPSAGGHTLVRKVSGKLVRAAKLADYFESKFEKQARLAIKYLADLKDEKKRKELEARIPLNEKQIEARAKARADFIGREIGNLPRTHYFKVREERKVTVQPAMRYDPKVQYADDTKLFSIGAKEYTYADLKKELPGEYSAEDRMKLGGLWMDTTILAEDETFKKSQASNLYPFLKQTLEQNLLAQAYFRKNMKDPVISDKQIRDLFQVRRNTLYKGKGFGTVRKDIERELSQGEKRAEAQKIQKQLAEQFKLRIFRDKLEANSL